LPDPALLFIENGELYTPRHRGRGSVLVGGGQILSVGEISGKSLAHSGVEVDTLDASQCLVIPGLVDPHEHLIGGSGEHGFQSQTPEIFLQELVRGGITSVVGTLGVDTVTKTMPALLGKVKALRAEGVSAYLYTGGYSVPPATLTGSARTDIVLIEEVIGVGETAIADRRSSHPAAGELARLASEAYTGGILSGKAGVLHLHIGEDSRRLADVRALLEEHHVAPEALYPTHVERSPKLFDEALDLARRGVVVDVDVMEGDLPVWFRRYRESGAPEENFTASTDAGQSSPSSLLEQIRQCVLRNGVTLEQALPTVTSNTAAVLKLTTKGGLAPGCDGDVVLLDRATLEPRFVVAGGKVMMRDSLVTARETFLSNATRRIHLDGAEER
jgi:beta-aspartyl-dipeptidase (metallo-type)